MAVRLISTKVAIQGESEYKNSIKNINASLKTMKTEMSLVDAQFQQDAKSKEAVTAKTKALTAVLDAQKAKIAELRNANENAQQAQQKYATQITDTQAKLTKAESMLEKAKTTTMDTTLAQQKLTGEVEKYKKELELAEASQDAARAGAQKWQQQINAAEKEVFNLTAKLENLAKLRLDGIQEQIDKISGRLHAAGDAVMPFSVAATAGMTAAAKAAIDFEDALAGVAKTTDLTDRELSEIKEEIRGLAMEIPMAAKELAGITEMAGQLGIEKENLVDFTETMANLGVATDLAGTQAATTAAQFANITQMNQQNFDRWGSTIVELGNNMATTESKIADMSLRLAAAGSQAGMTEAEILAVAGTFASLGMEAQAGGSAVSKIMTEITLAVETGSDNLDDFAQVANMSASKFASAWKNDAAGALVTFVEGLSDVERTGKSATVILDEMGITELRTSDALRRAAGAGDLFRRSIELAGNAWDENSALAEEAAKRYETTASQIQLLKNEAVDLAIEMGDMLLPTLRDLISSGREAAEWFKSLDDATKGNILQVIAFTAALGPLLKLTGTATTTIGAVYKGVVVLTTATGAQKVATDAATASQVGLNAAMAANPVGLVITAIGALVAVVGALALANKLASDSQNKLNEEISDTITKSRDAADAIRATADAKLDEIDAVESLLPRLEELNEKGFARTSEEQAELNEIVKQTSELFPELVGQIDNTTGRYEANTEAILANAEAMKLQQQIQANEALLAENKKLLLELEEKEIEATELLIAEKQRLRETNLDELMLTEEQKEEWYQSVDAAAEVRLGVRALTEEKERLNQEIDALTSNTEGLAAEFDKAAFQIAKSGEQTVANIQTQINYYESLRRTGISAYMDIAMAARSAGRAQSATAQKDIAFIDAELERLQAMLPVNTAGETTRSGFTASGASKAGGSGDKKTALDGYKAELEVLDYLHSMGEVSTAEYYQKLAAMRDEHLEENTSEWRSVNIKLQNYQKGEYDRELAAVKDSYNLQRMTSEEYLEQMSALQEKHLEKDSDAWDKARQDIVSQEEKIYDERMALQKYFLSMGIITEEKYYAEMAKLRDQYLSENSAKWRDANLQLLNHQKSTLEKLAEQQAKAAKDAQSEIEAMTKNRIESIKREIAAEEKRVSTIVDGINSEIEARRRLRQEESNEDAVARARKALEAAQGQLEFARDDYSQAEWEKEVARAQEAYNAAVQNKLDNDFFNQKNQQIAELQKGLEVYKENAQTDIDNAETWARQEYSRQQAGEAHRRAEMAAQDKAEQAAQDAASAVAQVVKNVVNTVQNVVNNRTASVNITNNSAQMTSGQIANTIEKLVK